MLMEKLGWTVRTASGTSLQTNYASKVLENMQGTYFRSISNTHPSERCWQEESSYGSKVWWKADTSGTAFSHFSNWDKDLPDGTLDPPVSEKGAPSLALALTPQLLAEPLSYLSANSAPEPVSWPRGGTLMSPHSPLGS